MTGKQQALANFAVLFSFYQNMLTADEKRAVDVCVEGLVNATNQDEAFMAILGLEALFSDDKGLDRILG